MVAIYTIKPILAVLVSICAVPLILVSRSANVREGWTFAAAIVKFLLIASMVAPVLNGGRPTAILFQVLPDVAICFRIDAMGILFALVSSLLWIVTSAYSIGYMRGLSEHSQTRYFCFFAVSLSATIGVAFSGNLLTLYLFYEMLSFSTYPLVTHHQDAEAKRSGRKYLLYIVGTSIGLVLPAMLITYHFAGTLTFSEAGLLPADTPPALIGMLLIFFLFGFAKSGIMPFHSWLPAAMVAPTPVSALLHAVAVVKVGVFCILRVMTGVFGIETLSSLPVHGMVGAAASVTILAASLIALSQDELKRRLAFSTIGQLSYIVLGVALLSPSGLAGSLLHIAMHAVGKITLFFCAGAIFVATGIRKISQMKGIGKQMPVTLTAFLIGSLSVIGLPPCGGFISKWYLVLGTLESNQPIFLAVILISSFLNAAYFLPIVFNAFFRGADKGSPLGDAIAEAPMWCIVPLVTTAALCLWLFFYPQPLLNLAKQAAVSAMGGM
ncbi:MAG: monovalent cation/H+ antiporter subunit D family protein [Deltaproteobacteria bacterium]|nr:monovalent cation/H+ antiporter subunit D family protein [Deltaproteobacteria bacterium]